MKEALLFTPIFVKKDDCAFYPTDARNACDIVRSRLVDRYAYGVRILAVEEAVLTTGHDLVNECGYDHESSCICEPTRENQYANYYSRNSGGNVYKQRKCSHNIA
ncbi:hypothetical protein TNCV_3282051 [Trichonephila clavipes]|nr:hypothetical protein TNCV_3282051 [Trichonephila clavipes]